MLRQMASNWSGPALMTAMVLLLALSALLVPNVPVWAGDGEGGGGPGVPAAPCSMYYCDWGCMGCMYVPDLGLCGPPQGYTEPCRCNTAAPPCTGCACGFWFNANYPNACRCQ